jgi:phosphate transport system permease protein
MNTSTNTAAALATGSPIDASRLQKYKRRKLVNAVALTLSLSAMAFGLFWLAWILIETVRLGLGGLSLSIFTEHTAPHDEAGGLANSILGSLTMVSLATLAGTPVGIMAGIYLAEYGQKSTLASCTRFVNDILLSAPSIVIGLFVSMVVVFPMGSSSGMAGAIALSLIVIPVVLRTTEDMLMLVPNGLREAAYALGAPKWKVILSITLKASRAGVITGILLALARIAGETAPLLYTAGSNDFMASSLWRSMDSLPVRIYMFAMSPYDEWKSLAWAGVFLITMGVLVLNILARVFFRNKQ